MNRLLPGFAAPAVLLALLAALPVRAAPPSTLRLLYGSGLAAEIEPCG